MSKVLSSSVESLLVQRLQEWRHDPVTFVRMVFGAEPTWQQAKILEAISRNNSVAVASGHGIGKSATNAWAIAWFLLTRPNSKVICTAPTKAQLFDILWSELKLWLNRARFKELTSLLDVKTERITVGNRTEWFARARAINVQATPEEQAETLAGYHAEHLLVVMDEASGIPDPVFRPIDGYMTKEDNRILMTSNPSRASGVFFEIFNNPDYGQDWVKFQFSSEESPNVDPSYPRRMEAKYGRDSNEYRIRVLGQFPLFDSSTLISWTDIQNSLLEGVPSELPPNVVWGIDPAFGGADEAVILPRAGSIVLEPITISGLKPVALADWIIAQYERAEVKPTALLVEGDGGGGVADILRHRLGNIVYEVIVNTRPWNQIRFYRLRDELWWKVREAFQLGFLRLFPDKELIRQLKAIGFDEIGGKVKVWDKKKLKKALKKSPDRADALMLSMALETDFTYVSPVNRYPRQRLTWRGYYA